MMFFGVVKSIVDLQIKTCGFPHSPINLDAGFSNFKRIETFKIIKVSLKILL